MIKKFFIKIRHILFIIDLFLAAPILFLVFQGYFAFNNTETASINFCMQVIIYYWAITLALFIFNANYIEKIVNIMKNDSRKRNL